MDPLQTPQLHCASTSPNNLEATKGPHARDTYQLGKALHGPPALFPADSLLQPRTRHRPPLAGIQYDMWWASRLIHEATVWLPSTSPARWRWHRQIRWLSLQRLAQRACAHRHNQLWAHNSPTSEAQRLQPAPHKPWPHIVAPTSEAELGGNVCAHLYVAPLTSRYSIWVGRRSAVLAHDRSKET
jgi:hypothetical protein